jgi:hypothetical protein
MGQTLVERDRGGKQNDPHPSVVSAGLEHPAIDQFRGVLVRIDGESARVKNGIMNDLAVPRAGLVSLTRSGAVRALYEGPSANEEWVRQGSPFKVAGKVLEVPQGQVVGRKLPAMPRRARIDFKAGEAAADPGLPRFQLRDGTTLAAKPLKIEKGVFHCESASAGTVRIPVAQLQQITWPAAAAGGDDEEEAPEQPSTGTRVRSSIRLQGDANVQIQVIEGL